MANGDLDSYYGNLFFRIQSGRWAHNIILTCGWNDASLDRTAGIPGAGMYTMHGSTSGSSYGAFYEGTYDLYLNENNTSALQPLVNASVYRSRMDGFTESGGLGMNVDDMDSTYINGSIAAMPRCFLVYGGPPAQARPFRGTRDGSFICPSPSITYL